MNVTASVYIINFYHAVYSLCWELKFTSVFNHTSTNGL